MNTDNLQSEVADRLIRLNEAMADYRKSEERVRSIKAEIAELNAESVKRAVTDGPVNPAEFAHLVDSVLDPW